LFDLHLPNNQPQEITPGTISTIYLIISALENIKQKISYYLAKGELLMLKR